MENDWIDASVGLAFSLTVFARYRRSGLLRAELQHVPGFRGRCVGLLQLIEGRVVSCILEDAHGEYHAVSKEMLVRLDSAKGPFEWVLIPHFEPSPGGQGTTRSKAGHPVPRRVGALHAERLGGWSSRQKLILTLVFDAIDGQRTLQEIQELLPLSAQIVREAFHILVALNVVDCLL